jgi:hypothetical protein
MLHHYKAHVQIDWSMLSREMKARGMTLLTPATGGKMYNMTSLTRLITLSRAITNCEKSALATSAVSQIQQ